MPSAPTKQAVVTCPAASAGGPEDLDVKAGAELPSFYRTSSVRYGVYKEVFVRATAKLTHRRGGNDQALFVSFGYDPAACQVMAIAAEMEITGPADESVPVNANSVA